MKNIRCTEKCCLIGSVTGTRHTRFTGRTSVAEGGESYKSPQPRQVASQELQVSPSYVRKTSCSLQGAPHDTLATSQHILKTLIVLSMVWLHDGRYTTGLDFRETSGSTCMYVLVV